MVNQNACNTPVNFSVFRQINIVVCLFGSDSSPGIMGSLFPDLVAELVNDSGTPIAISGRGFGDIKPSFASLSEISFSLHTTMTRVVPPY